MYCKFVTDNTMNIGAVVFFYFVLICYMSGLNGGRGRGRTVRNYAGRGTPQPTPQYDPADQNYETNTFSGMFGGFLDPTQPFGNYFGSMNEQPHMQPPLVGAGMQPPLVGAGIATTNSTQYSLHGWCFIYSITLSTVWHCQSTFQQ